MGNEIGWKLTKMGYARLGIDIAWELTKVGNCTRVGSDQGLALT